MRGTKWMREASYLTDDDRDEIMRMVSVAKEQLSEPTNGDLYGVGFDARSVGVRPPALLVEPAPIACITFGPGGCSLYAFVYRRIA